MGEHMTGEDFREIVWGYYRYHARADLPWRQSEPDGSLDPYKVLTSEIMLQQTQVARVIPKYEAFLDAFPTAKHLARAELGEVLRHWNGLGYNRRAKYLWSAARKIEDEYSGTFPNDMKELTQLPGVGKNTAGAVLAYAYNRRVAFVETNIRTVFIYHFFRDSEKVPDKAIEQYVQKTLPEGEYRDWYWALMDYGNYLKRAAGNPGRNSAAYSRQSRFAGSFRQIRGQVIKSLREEAKGESTLRTEIADERLHDVIEVLLSEGLIRRKHGKLSL